MRAKMLRRADRKIAALALSLGAAALPAGRGAAAEPLDITLDQATLMKLPDKVATIVVGNPMIADVAVQSGGLVVVTGKGLRLDQPDRARPRRRGADGARHRGARAGATRPCRSFAASSARPIAARRIANAASRSAIPPTISAPSPDRPKRATARRRAAGPHRARRRRADPEASSDRADARVVSEE